MNDKWCTVSEAAGLLGVSTETVRRHIKSGKLEGRKEGNQYVVKLTDVTGPVAQSVSQMTAIDVVQLEGNSRLLEERNQMLEKRIKDLEEDKGFLLNQIAEKDKQIEEKDLLIGKLTPLALPAPKTTLRERLKGMFRKSVSSN